MVVWFGGVNGFDWFFYLLGSGPGCVVLGQRMGWGGVCLCLDLIRVRLVFISNKPKD